MTSGLLNAVVAEDLPGPGSVFLHVDWSSWRRSARATRSRPRSRCSRCRDDKPIAKVRTTITNQDGTVVLDGNALVYRVDLTVS